MLVRHKVVNLLSLIPRLLILTVYSVLALVVGSLSVMLVLLYYSSLVIFGMVLVHYSETYLLELIQI